MLYALGLDMAAAGASWEMTKDSPAVRQDRDGHFVDCPSCSKRVALEKITVEGQPRWLVSAKQKC